MISKSSFLISGGTGSFGKTMLKHLIKKNASEIRILSRDEKKQEKLRLETNSNNVKFIIGDVRDYDCLKKELSEVNYVFHAAALKQVPSCEFYPLEAIKTNIIGTENIIKAAYENKVKSLVLLSTDKSVYPINAMGMTKALAEKLILSNSGNNKTKLSITRYGNVMGSRGSVIPLFIDQIKRGLPITVTDYDMTRFLLSLDESIELVMKAFRDGDNGDIFVKKAPAVSIRVLLKAVEKIFNSTAKIKIIGTRHGEKLYETLISREEIIRTKEMKNYFCIKADRRSINYDDFFQKGKKEISTVSEYNSHNCKQLNVDEAVKILLKTDFIKRELND